MERKRPGFLLQSRGVWIDFFLSGVPVALLVTILVLALGFATDFIHLETSVARERKWTSPPTIEERTIIYMRLGPTPISPEAVPAVASTLIAVPIAVAWIAWYGLWWQIGKKREKEGRPADWKRPRLVLPSTGLGCAFWFSVIPVAYVVVDWIIRQLFQTGLFYFEQFILHTPSTTEARIGSWSVAPDVF